MLRSAVIRPKGSFAWLIHPTGFEPVTFDSAGALLPFGKSRFHPMAIGILAD
jgi:hypothetical protein